ncbi:hypothetical protein [Microlunatus sp. Y2014]|uniref:hypothetical protein n=1 Tax=Microlunatus sp. Y2014 TaxID=3418488 RepID=UPI003DA76ABE
MELVLALVAIILSVVSLAWQIASHRLSGHRVVVRLGSAIPVGPVGDLYPPCRTIEVTNKGRGPVTVNWLFRLVVGAGC